ncbi:MAG: DUF1338 family protein [Acidimicrobiia bacterium]
MNQKNNMILASPDVTIYSVLRDLVGGARIDDFSHVILVPEQISSFGDENVSRAQISMSLFLALYADLLDRVPHALEYFQRRKNEEQTIFLDHGAVRTVLTLRNGSLPPGETSITRILIPLGYFNNDVYPLEKLKMTGRSYAHSDLPEVLPQYFVSEFHPEKVGDDNFEKAVISVVEDSRDPLDQETLDNLTFIAEHKYLPREKCTNFLGALASAFSRQHPTPLLSAYEELKKYSAEMAWIATEGNAFNHGTDRVDDVMALSEDEHRLNAPIKDTVEVSRSGNILQTAYRADMVSRAFRFDDDEIVHKEVPGSFFEFITRHKLEDGTVDLAFDANNATAIFAMTKDEDNNLEEEFIEQNVQED